MADECKIYEEVFVRSRHVRLSQLRSPMCCCLIPKLRDRLMSSLAEYHVVAGKREIQFCTALEEALNNAFYHGYPELTRRSNWTIQTTLSRTLEAATEHLSMTNFCGTDAA